MSKGSAAQPAAVDPTALAGAQTTSNIATATNQAALNNASTFSPFGSSIWTPSTNAQGQTTYALNQNLSPQLSQLFGGQTNLASLLAGTAGPQAAGSGYNLTSQGQGLFGQAAGVANQIPTSLNYSNVAPIQTLTPQSFNTNVNAGPIQSSVAAGGPVQSSVNANFPQLVKQAQDAAYQSQTQYLDPQFQQGESNLRQTLADQGIQEGTPAFDRAMLNFNNQKQQAYQSAQEQAVAAGNQQEQSLFGQSLGAGQFANAAQAQLFGQGVTQGTFANQAQQQQFGQGLSLADLYNQAVTAATGQGNTATQLGMQQAQAQAQQPINALQALLAGGTGMYGAGLQGMGAAGGMVNQAPTWPLSIPTMGGTPTTVTPTNVPGAYNAATSANTLANQALSGNMSGLFNTLSPALFGQGGISNLTGANGLFGEGGLFGGLFGGGGAAGMMIPGTSTGLDLGSAAFAAGPLVGLP